MTRIPRWISGAAAEALVCETPMPWERGARRAAMIARRKTGQNAPDARTDAFDAAVDALGQGKTAA